MKKKFTLLIMSTALLLFIAGVTQIDFQVNYTDFQAISGPTDTGGGGTGPATIGQAIAIAGTDILATTAGMRSDTPNLTAPDRYAIGHTHLESENKNLTSDYLVIANMGGAKGAPTTSNTTFRIRT